MQYHRRYTFGLTVLVGAMLTFSILVPPVQPVQAQSASLPHLIGTYLGGNSSVDYGRAVAVDAQGFIYVAGDTASTTFAGFDLQLSGSRDALVLKLSPDGKQVVGGFVLGSTGADEVIAMSVTPAGEPVLTVIAGENDWPVVRPFLAEQPYGNEGVLVKLNAALNEVVFSTYTGFHMTNEGGQNVGLDAEGNIYVTGDAYNATERTRDLIVQRYSPDGQQRVERVFANDRTGEYGHSLAVRPDGTVYVTGQVRGDDRPLL